MPEEESGPSKPSREIPEELRQRLLETIRGELEVATHGKDPVLVAAELDRRTAILRRQIAELNQ